MSRARLRRARYLVEVRRPVETKDEAGGISKHRDDFAVVARSYAEIEPMSARRVTIADSRFAEATHTIRFRERGFKVQVHDKIQVRTKDKIEREWDVMQPLQTPDGWTEVVARETTP